MYDKKQMVCTVRPGFQPGWFGLVPGKCAVGALARVPAPPRGVPQSVEVPKGRKADVQVIQGGDPSLSPPPPYPLPSPLSQTADDLRLTCEHGRHWDTIRRPHREAQVKKIELVDDLVLCTVNMQGQTGPEQKADT